MAQVILIDDNKTMYDLVTNNLKAFLGVEIIPRNTANEAISFLNILPDVDLIIAKHSMRGENTAQILLDYINKNNLEMGLIIVGGKKHSNYSKRFVHVEQEKDWESVITNTARILGFGDKVFVKKMMTNYLSVPVRYFLNLDNVNCDVFIRIKKNPLDYQYLKRIHQGDSISLEAVEHYLSQGLESFYVPAHDYKNFSINLSNKIIQKLEDKKLDLPSMIHLLGNSYEIAVKEIAKIGFTEETIQLTDSVVHHMIDVFEKNPEMSVLLHKIINSNTGQLYQRGHMTSIVANEILKNLKITDEYFSERLAFASFFHDITLIDQISLSKINSVVEIEENHLIDVEKDLVNNHAFEAAILARKFPEIPKGVDEIIKHHHGSASGKGFSNQIEELPDLSKIFIIAHHFVLELVRFKESGGAPKPIIENLYEMFPTPASVTIIKALERTLQKKKNSTEKIK